MEVQTCKKRVMEYMEVHRMAEPGDGILAAVSGGADSVCLLRILSELSGEYGFRLAAFHLNHGLRGAEAERDEQYVKELCGKLEIPLVTARADVARYARENGLSEEEAGRRLRYRYLEQTAEKLSCDRIATAHHRADNVETVLMNLFRGSGLKGLGGIRPVRGRVIRPLLCLERDEIEAYLLDCGVFWCEDSTNRELEYARNRVRNVLVPWVKENINDRAGEHILNTAKFASQADEYFEGLADRLLDEDGSSGRDTDRKREVSIRTKLFDSQPDIVKAYLVRAMIRRAAGQEKDISARHIEAVCALAGPGRGTAADLPYGIRAVRGYDRITITTKPGTTPGPTADLKEEKKTEIPDFSVETRKFPWKKEMEIPQKRYTKWFDYDKIMDTLSLRHRESGDYFLIEGGKTKLLKRYFIDEKIPAGQRDQIWLLTEGNHVLWAIGYRISEYYKISETTNTVLEVRICKGEEHV